MMTARAREIKSCATIAAMAKRTWLRRSIGLGLLAGAAYALWRAMDANRMTGESEWEPQPFPFPPQPRTGPDAAERGDRAELARERTPVGRASRPTESERERWTTAVDGTCPATHPVKAKEASKIFHVPGGLSYERTVPDRCYADPAAAEADGFRAAKR